MMTGQWVARWLDGQLSASLQINGEKNENVSLKIKYTMNITAAETTYIGFI